jgi:hypothetical protein
VAHLLNALQTAYFIEPATVVNVDDRFVPSVVTAVMMTTAIKAAISPYSIAVAPSSFARKQESVLMEVAPG